MGISNALIAFLEALGGPRTAPGAAVAPVPPPSAPVQSPLGPTVEQLVIRVADLEAQLAAMKTWVNSELSDAVRKADNARRSTQRIADSVRELLEEPDAGEDVHDDDARAGAPGRVQPVRTDMARARGPSPEQSLEEFYAAARRATAMM